MFHTAAQAMAALKPSIVRRWRGARLWCRKAHNLKLTERRVRPFEFVSRSSVPALQAVAAVNAFNGEEIAGRKILVREDREDRDVKQYNRENGIERPNTRRPKRGGRGGAGRGGAEQGSRSGGAQREPQQPSGLQASSFSLRRAPAHGRL